jgi:F0F1-type ATP synthase alpha subunit
MCWLVHSGKLEKMATEQHMQEALASAMQHLQQHAPTVFEDIATSKQLSQSSERQLLAAIEQL